MDLTKNKIGSSAVATVFDIEESQKRVIPTGKTNRYKKRIHYPIFIECSEIIDDSFWKSKLVDAAYGKFPKGFSYSNSQLNYRRGNKTASIELEGDTSDITTMFIEFLKVNGGLFSTEEEIEKYEDVYVPDLSWKNANSKTRNNLVNNYVDEMGQKLDLTRAERDDMKYVIECGIKRKIFNNSTVFVNPKELKIENIKNFEWDDSERKFKIVGVKNTESKCKIDSHTDSIIQKDTIPDFTGAWYKLFSSKLQKLSSINTTPLNFEGLDGYTEEPSTDDI